ncbi:hypothetical protein E2I00_009136, partial [Balaenoptera physalus]
YLELYISLHHGHDPKEPEQLRKLFFGGLSVEHFEKWGTLTDCVVMRDPQTKHPRAFGFVTYSCSHTRWMRQCVPDHTRLIKLFLVALKKTQKNIIRKTTLKSIARLKSQTLWKTGRVEKREKSAFVIFGDHDTVDKTVVQKHHTLNGHNCEVKKTFSKEEMQSVGLQRGGGRCGNFMGHAGHVG